MKIKGLLFLILILFLIIFAESDEVTLPTNEIQKTEFISDSLELLKLKKEILQLKLETAGLEKQKHRLNTEDNIYRKIDSESNGFDTLKLKTKESAKAFLHSFSGTKRNTRERGYGGAMGPAFGINAVNVKEAIKAVSWDNNLGKFSFDGDYETFLMLGGIMYGGIGNGFRVGGAGWGGARSFTSLDANSDKSVSLSLGYGGFLMEKCFVLGPLNTVIGGILGAGALTVTPQDTGEGLFDFDNTKEAKASFMLIELHGGITYTMKTWMHFGVDLTAPIFISPHGYKINDASITNGFSTINPGLRLKLIFGNLG